jgi:hypothetical protein
MPSLASVRFQSALAECAGGFFRSDMMLKNLGQHNSS